MASASHAWLNHEPPMAAAPAGGARHREVPVEHELLAAPDRQGFQRIRAHEVMSRSPLMIEAPRLVGVGTLLPADAAEGMEPGS